MTRTLLVPLLVPLLVIGSPGCAGPARSAEPAPPVPGALPADDLIQPGEEHFARLWQITAGGENAEGYWSFGGERLVLQRSDEAHDVECDRIYVTGEGAVPAAARERERAPAVPLRQVSDGRGTTTCAYFLPGDESVLYASTGFRVEDCPPDLDYSQGYVWAIHPEYELCVTDLGTGETRLLTDEWGYDAEATVSPRGDRIVFTSTRSGDLELWACDLDGSDLVQLTDELGYDGGGFFSHDGEHVVFRTTAFTPGKEAEERARYRELLDEWRVRPHSMELVLVRADGTGRRRLTDLGGANFAPFFFPDDRRVIFSTNHHEESARNFDLFAIDVDGGNLERITTYDGFDSFPMFDPSGRWLAFASNRGGVEAGETNLFVAEWRD